MVHLLPLEVMEPIEPHQAKLCKHGFTAMGMLTATKEAQGPSPSDYIFVHREVRWRAISIFALCRRRVGSGCF